MYNKYYLLRSKFSHKLTMIYLNHNIYTHHPAKSIPMLMTFGCPQMKAGMATNVISGPHNSL
jgi:hypothetical protein